MLVLSRTVGEKILIGHDIILTVTRMNRRQVWIGIEAPTEVSVHREEVYKAIRAVDRAIKEAPDG